MTEQVKVCTSCGDEKPFRDLYTKRSGKYGRASSCKVCHLDASTARRLTRARVMVTFTPTVTVEIWDVFKSKAALHAWAKERLESGLKEMR